MKILITDDSVFMRKMLLNTLNSLGYTEVLQAQNGDEAVNFFKSEKPDITFLDIVMEGKDGISALQEIKAIDSNAKVIMLSAVGQESKINEAKSAGAIEFITKPFKNDQIQSAIAKVSGQ